MLAKADAELIIAEQRCPLFANCWASGVIAPEGHLAIESFELDGTIPVWRFAVDVPSRAAHLDGVGRGTR